MPNASNIDSSEKSEKTGFVSDRTRSLTPGTGMKRQGFSRKSGSSIKRKSF
jgi:hypothetical protein